MLATWLNRDGVPTTCASTTLEGLETIKLRHPAVVVVDLKLLHPPTLEFAKTIRETPASSDIPIMLISGTDEQTLREGAIELQNIGNHIVPVGYLHKPFSMETFYNELSRLLGSREWINPNSLIGLPSVGGSNPNLKLSPNPVTNQSSSKENTRGDLPNRNP